MRRSHGSSRLGRRVLLYLVVLSVALAGSSCTLAGPEPRPLPPGPTPERAGGSEGRAEEAASRDDLRDASRDPVPAAVTDVRALWVVRTSLIHPDSVRAMVRRAHRAGFNTLLVQVRGRGDAWYDSSLEPPPAALAAAPAGYDPLALVLREARERGLAVHAWVNAHLVHGVGPLPDDPRHLVRSRPGWLAVPRELAGRLRGLDPAEPAYARALRDHARREGLEGVYTSPAHPEVRDHLVAVWTELAERYDLDGLHLDYVRYPAPWFDYSPAAVDAFRSWARGRIAPERARELDRAGASDPLAWPDALPDRWDAFRREAVTELVRRVRRELRARRPGLVLTAAVRADADEARRDRFQDWPAWLDEGLVDAVAPMAYTDDAALFRRWIAEAVGRGGPRIWAGVGTYKTTFRGTVEQLRTARELGAGGVAVFSYDWAVREGRSERSGTPFLQGVGEAAFGAR